MSLCVCTLGRSWICLQYVYTRPSLIIKCTYHLYARKTEFKYNAEIDFNEGYTMTAEQYTSIHKYT